MKKKPFSKIPSVKGVHDVLPGGQAEAFQLVEDTGRKLLEDYGFMEIRIPVFEYTDLFARGIGTATDIVEKEMYTFADRDLKKITLRPEGTASVVRAFIQHNLSHAFPLSKLYYTGPMFRHERPQAGRYRQFHQIGAEVLGITSPTIDAEIISLMARFFDALKISGLEFQINSLGCHQCRPPYRQALKEFLKDRLERLCENCRRRYTKNPMRVLDCRLTGCQKTTQGSPASIDHLCEGCFTHFMEVKNCLNQLKIPFQINERLVRGLDYYVRTAFEVVSTRLGAQNAVAAGGRYDGLVHALGGPDVAGIGFAIGTERVISLLDQTLAGAKPDCFLAVVGDQAKQLSLPALHRLRQEGVRIETDYENSSLKSQMRRADRLGARYVVIIGDDEIARGKVILRDMTTQQQHEMDLETWMPTLIQKLQAG